MPMNRGHVEAQPRELRVYETPDGTFPFDEWLGALRDAAGRARIDARLLRVETGNFGDCKPVGEGVLELKVDFGPGYRVYLAPEGPTLVLLLIGGDKSTQTKDIKTAQAYWEDHRKRAS